MSECYAPTELPTDLDPSHDEPADNGSTYEYLDLDGDGYTETTEIDSNGDGEIDAVLTDVDGDFYDDIAAFDNSPGDHTFVPDVVAIAADGDGLADVIFDDTNFDGVFDAVLPGGDEPLPYANPYELSAGVAPTEQPFAQAS
jgi:hypothetical protein